MIYIKRMLDDEMVYSCGYWNGAENLSQAQIAKLDLICRKLDLKPGMKVLDIGSGWGALLKACIKKLWSYGNRRYHLQKHRLNLLIAK
jgi:cyclopropane fatty-acyl-phospholipid synthase-like methyltransferase